MSWARRWSCTQYPPRVDADGESSRRCLAPKVVPIVVGSPDLARWRGTAESPACPLEQRQLQLEVGDAVRGVGRAERLRHQIDVVGDSAARKAHPEQRLGDLEAPTTAGRHDPQQLVRDQVQGVVFDRRGSGKVDGALEVVRVHDPVSYTHLRAHETRHDLVCRLLLEKKKKKK